MVLDCIFRSTTCQVDSEFGFKLIDELSPDRSKVPSELIKITCGHWQLNKWMENLYRNKGGKSECFSLINIKLSETDLLKLREDIQSWSLPKGTRYDFYLPESEMLKVENIEQRRKLEAETYKEDMQIIDLCLKEIAEGKTVFYRCWW